MGKNTYIGGGSTVRLTETGTSWDANDPASERRERPPRPPRDRRPTDEEIRAEERAEQAREQKRQEEVNRATDRFIRECVDAHIAAKLTPFYPKPPAELSDIIERAGGNMKWLGRSVSNQVAFHELFCKRIGEDIPFEHVWGPPDRNNKKHRQRKKRN